MTQISNIITPQQLQKIVLEWALQYGRHDLPWQHSPTPYSVLVSEVMLQQTQVTTVIPYFQRWMNLFPNIEALATASIDDVMQLWQGLGYYSRAQNLIKAAQYINKQFGGVFPKNKEDLLTIPGVGPYTAGAILSFAFNQFGPIVDGNVTRLFARLFKIESPIGDTQTTKRLWQLAQEYTPQKNNRAFAQGLLDLGATLCTSKTPACHQCPFNQKSLQGKRQKTWCAAYENNLVHSYPIAKIKKQLPTKTVYFKWCLYNHKLLLEKRPNHGIWANLWSLPSYSDHLESDAILDPNRAKSSANTPPIFTQFNHRFTHYKLDAQLIKSQPPYVLTQNQTWVTIDDLNDIALPTPMRTVIEKHFK